MKKNGFTLVELIAVLTLLAIVMLLVVPGVQGLKQENQKKQYETYLDMMIEYSKTVSTSKNYVCYKKLKIKPISSDINCNGYVSITSTDRKAYLRCSNKEGQEMYKSTGYSLPSDCN